MTERQERWNRRLDGYQSDSPIEPLILDEVMIRQWLQEHRAEYSSATDTIRACLQHFGLHRRHKKMVWNIYCNTEFGHIEA